MKPGQLIKIRSARSDDYQEYELIEILEESVKVKHPTIGGYFIFSKKLVIQPDKKCPRQ